MATIVGSNVSPAFTRLYELVISRWTVPRLARLRARLLAPRFAVFGPGSGVSFQCRILEPAKISIGARTTLPNWSVLDGRGGLSIGDNCLIGFENVILTSTHVSSSVDAPIKGQGFYQRPVHIGDDVWTGCRVVVLPGVTIGSHAIIAAGSVVSRDIPEWAVAGGVPARVIRDRRDDQGDESSFEGLASSRDLR